MVEILYEIRNDIRFESNFYRGNCRVLTRAVLDILKDKFKCEPWLVKVISGYDHTFPVIDLNGDKIIVDFLGIENRGSYIGPYLEAPEIYRNMEPDTWLCMLWKMGN